MFCARIASDDVLAPSCRTPASRTGSTSTRILAVAAADEVDAADAGDLLDALMVYH